MIQSLFLLSPSGEVLIERHFRGAVTERSICDIYWSTVAERNHHHPVIEIPSQQQGTLYVISIRQEGLSYLAVCKDEVSPLMIIELLHRMANIFRDYFGNADETAITDNFSMIYQLLEEMIDHGHPMTFEENALRAMIRPPSVMDKLMNNTSTVSDSLPSGAVSNMPWRTEAHYQNNEIYVDMLEEVDAIIDMRGNVVSSHVRGSIQCRSLLSGTPDLLLTFNDPSIIGDDCSFHPCVRYSRFEKERVVSFVPPDGNFELMRYRVHQSHNFVPPVQCIAQWGAAGRLSLQVSVTSFAGLIFSASAARNKVVEELVVTVPFPKGTLNTSDISVSIGAFVYDEASKVLQWNVAKSMDASQKATLTCKYELGESTSTSTSSGNSSSGGYNNKYPPMSERRRRLCEKSSRRKNPDDHRLFSPPNISLGWKIPLASVSGLSVSGLSLLHERYRPYKGVRNVTAAGPYYQVRCS